MSFDLKAYLEKWRTEVRSALEAYLPETRERLTAAMRHSLFAGGKRLRPILCLSAAEAVGGEPEQAMPAACALEMIHTYSLIHDDLPAMDDDTLRRGIPTCHTAFDEATAILAGDALLTLAFEIMAETGMVNGGNPRNWLQVIREIARASGCLGMVEGQMRDMAAEKRQADRIDRSELEAMHELKTGALIEASVASGAVLGGGSANDVSRLKTYARHIGLAFQVTDDILNVEGDPRLMGKAVGTDAERNKSAYPALMGLEGSRRFASELIRDAVKALETFHEKGEPLRALALYILERKR